MRHWFKLSSRIAESKGETGDGFTISAGREFHNLTTRLQKKFLVVSNLILSVLSLKLWHCILECIEARRENYYLFIYLLLFIIMNLFPGHIVMFTITYFVLLKVTAVNFFRERSLKRSCWGGWMTCRDFTRRSSETLETSETKSTFTFSFRHFYPLGNRPLMLI